MPSALRLVGISLLAILLLAFVAVGFYFLDSGPNDSLMVGAESAVTAANQFAGSLSCRECHRELFDQFSVHPMALSLRLVGEDDLDLAPTSSPTVIPGRQRGLTVQRMGNNLVHSEQAYDQQNQLIFNQPHTMKYVVGSGRRARAYLERRGELLFMSPLNWYGQSQAWNLAPGYVADDIRRFDRRVRDDCLACHGGRPVVHEPGANIYPEPIFHETGIGCERCHGPASQHVNVHAASKLKSSQADLIVNPEKLEPDRRDAVCYQCHLESAARVLLPGKSHLDFRPGMQLSEIWAILDQGTQVTDSGHTRSVNHVQQMRDSRCYVASAGKMGCTSCHDPHSTPRPDLRSEFYRQRCLSCHADDACTETMVNRQQQQNDCVSCHMPLLNSSNMTHVAQTDHRVLRRLEAPSPSGSADAPTDEEISLHLFGSAQEQLSPDQKQRSLVLGTVLYCQRKGMPIPTTLLPMLEQLRSKQARQQDSDTELLIKLGGVYLDRALVDQAESCFQECLSTHPDNEFAQDGLLEALYRQAKWSETVAHASRMLMIEPSSSRTLAMRADALSQLGRNDEALADINRAIQANPGQVVLRQWQVDKLRAANRTDAANKAAIELERVRSSRPLAE